VNKLMVLREGTLAAFGPREDVLKALKNQGSPVAASRAADAPAPAKAVPPVLVESREPAEAAASAASGMPPFNLKFGD